MSKIFLSDCGQYIAIKPDGAGAGDYDIIAVDGSQIWLSGRYKPTGWGDTDPRYLYPEFAHMVMGVSNHGYRNRARQWVEDFDIRFADLDTSKKIDPLMGNCIRQSYSAHFKRPVRSLVPNRKRT